MRWILVFLLALVTPVFAQNNPSPPTAPLVSYIVSNLVLTANQNVTNTVNTYLPASGPAHPISIFVQTLTNGTITNAETGSNYTITVFPAYDVVGDPANVPIFGTNFCTNILAFISNSLVGTGVAFGSNITASQWQNATTLKIVISNSLSTNVTFTAGVSRSP